MPGKAKEEVKPNLDTDIKASAARMTELKRGRDIGDIPINDEYWKAVQNHNKYFGMNKG